MKGEKVKHLVVSKDIHRRIMEYKIHNGFRSINKLLRYWLDYIEKTDDQDPYKLHSNEKGEDDNINV